MSPFLYFNLRYDFLWVCVFIVVNAVIGNLWPNSEHLKNWPKLRYFYEMLIDVNSAFALRWRAQMPSLDKEFLGFRREIKHAYRNWQQGRQDKITITAASLEDIKVTRQE